MTTEVAYETLRSRSARVLGELKIESDKKDSYSWIQNAEQPHRSMRCRLFDHTGFLFIPSFASTDECEAMKQQMKELVDKTWKPEEALDCFGTDDTQNMARGDYFLDSAEAIHYFAETEAVEKDEASGTMRLKEEYRQSKIHALNKAGHAMHVKEGPFRDYCLSNKVRELVVDLGWEDPVVPQSMYICKPPLTGGVVTSHQDSTFLYTEPKQSCVGLWLALDEANLENGCLWVRPKSHREPVRRQFKRNPQHFGQEVIQSRSNSPAGDPEQTKFIMDDICKHGVSWEGGLPKNGMQGLLDAGFIPVECQPGDLLVFCGTLDHCSLANHSAKQRHTFQLHLVEGPGADVQWSESNWLQYASGKPFLRLL